MNPGQQYYPWYLFPPLLQNVASVVQAQTQAPLGLIYSMLIGVLAESMQGFLEVQLPDGPRCTTSTWILVLAQSGDGKTPAMKMLRQPITAFEWQMAAINSNELVSYNSQFLLWDTKLAELQSLFRKQIRLDLATDEIEQLIKAHMASKPMKPRLIKLSYPDATPEALIAGMGMNSPNVSIANDEASKFFNGHMANGLATLNQGWDGQPLIMDRRSLEEPIIVHQPRVSLILALQPALMETSQQRRGTEARELGSMPRFLICYPPNNQGFRNVAPSDIDTSPLEAFTQRITELLYQSVTPQGGLIEQKQVMHLTPAAAHRFHQFREDLECDIRPGGPLENVRDYVAKASRHAAKLAALFEYFGSGSRTISIEMLECAIKLTYWYIDEYQMVMTMPTEVEIIAKDFYEWLLDFREKRGNRYLVKNDILKYAPSKLRSSARLNEVANHLASQGMVRLFERDGLSILDLQPHDWNNERALEAAIANYRASRAKYR